MATVPEVMRKALLDCLLCEDLAADVQAGLSKHGITLTDPAQEATLQKFFDAQMSDFAGRQMKEFLLSLSVYIAPAGSKLPPNPPEPWNIMPDA